MDDDLPYSDFRNPDRRYDEARGRHDEENAMKLCKDCNHVRPALDGRIDRFARCALLEPTSSPVNGEPMQDNYCESMRLSSQPCGPEGKLWEAK